MARCDLCLGGRPHNPAAPLNQALVFEGAIMTTNTETLTYDHIVALALEHGFKLKPQVDGRMALNDYVIDFARAVYNIGHAAAKAETAAAVAAEREPA